MALQKFRMTSVALPLSTDAVNECSHVVYFATSRSLGNILYIEQEVMDPISWSGHMGASASWIQEITIWINTVKHNTALPPWLKTCWKILFLDLSDFWGRHSLPKTAWKTLDISESHILLAKLFKHAWIICLLPFRYTLQYCIFWKTIENPPSLDAMVHPTLLQSLVPFKMLFWHLCPGQDFLLWCTFRKKKKKKKCMEMQRLVSNKALEMPCLNTGFQLFCSS